MKKITFTLYLIFISIYGYSQNNLRGNSNYFLETDITLGIGFNGGPCGYGGLVWFHVTKSLGEQIFYKDNPGTMEDTWHNQTRIFNKLYFTEENLITSFSIFSTRRSPNAGSCRTDATLLINGRPINKYEYKSYVNSPNTGGVLANDFNGIVNFRTYPVVNLKNTDLADDLVGFDDNINIPAITGILNQFYTWQYTTNPNDIIWTNFPSQFQGINSLSAKISDFLPSNLIGSNFYIRVKTNDFGATRQGDFIKLRCLKSAPHILPTPPPTSTSCFDSSDGKIKVKLDRPFLNGEILGYNLLNVNNLQGAAVRSLAAGDPFLLDADNSFEINGLPAGTFLLELGPGFFNGDITYISGINHTKTYTITKPLLPVAFTATKTDVLCYNGNDGKILLTASGGTTEGINTYQYSLNLGNTWFPFTNGNTHIITGLNPSNYLIKVRDSRACVAKEQTPVSNDILLGDEIELPLTIQPIQSAVSLSNPVYMQQPTFYGATNGQLKATIKGGTRISNNNLAYNFVWKKDGLPLVAPNVTTVYNSFATAPLDNNLVITLNNVPAGNYSLTVTDKNYNNATQNEGCSIIDLPIVLNQPEPIVVTFTALPPKCNASNLFGNETDLNPADEKRDESQNGQLVATVTGGVPYTGFQNDSKPYKYFWKKQQPDGTWQSIDNQNTTLLYVSDGNYALNVEDSNLIKLGIYINNALTQEVDKTILVQQPAQLELALTKQDVTCGNANTGSATANVSGGVSGYTYQWNDANSSTTQTITGLGAGNYFVRVTDANGCIVQSSVNLPQPSNIVISDNVQNPSCFQGTDGAIDLIIRGGNSPFSYLWNTRARSEDLTNIPAGNYTVTITDRLGCSFQHNVVLINPDPIVVNLGSDRTLCNNQLHTLDISINDPTAQYIWTSTNGFTSRSASVNLTQAGTYHAKVISSLGCVGEDDIIIQTNQVNIESEFFVTSQAYLDEEVMLVNTSNPFGENTQWVIPNGVNIIDKQQKFVVLKFNTIGTHTISLKQTQGDCYAFYSKNIKVEDRSTIPNANNNNSPFIKDFIVTPNPNNGQFTTVVNLQEISPIKLRLFSYSGQTAIIQKSEAGKKNYVVDFNVALPSGTYVLVLETAQQTLIRKIIIL